MCNEKWTLKYGIDDDDNNTGDDEAEDFSNERTQEKKENGWETK